MTVDLTRRRLLIGAGAGGALLVAWTLWPRHYPDPFPPRADELGLDGWLRIAPDDTLTVAMPQLEMGQGVTTLLAQVAAIELGADWRKVAVAPALVSARYANEVLARRWAQIWLPLPLPGPAMREMARRERFTATADGTSLAAYEAPLRAAAASARALLAMAAAKRWGLDWQACAVEQGEVRHGIQRARFGELVVEARGLAPPDPPILRAAPAAERPLPGAGIGAPGGFARLDLPAKASGAQLFAADIRLPGMVHAAIRHAPMGAEAHLAHGPPPPPRGIPGFIRWVHQYQWLAAVANDWWSAERALARAAPTFSVHAPLDGLAIEGALDKALRGGRGMVIARLGDVDGAMGHATLSQRYDVAPAVHAGLETASATARLRDGLVEIWAPSQAPEAMRAAVADAMAVPLASVVLYPVAAGGSFDARLESEPAVEAALIARLCGRPVQLTWSRWQEHVAGKPRVPVAAQLTAHCDGAGLVTAWKLRAALPEAAREFGARLFDAMDPRAAAAASGTHADPLALEGAVPPYAIPNLTVEHVPTVTGLPAGRLRGNAHGYTAFFTECFLDELAAALHREPLSFRMAMLGGDPRLAFCLQQVSALAQWNGGGPNPDGGASGQGLACHRMISVTGDPAGGGCIAAIASARRDERGVRVDKIAAVADIGRIVNLDIARQQIEGGLIFGLGLAIGCATGWSQGLPTIGRLSGLGLPMLGDCPEISVELIDSAAEPFDPGELGVAVAAPAIANALASATGLRFRKLPLVSEE